MLNDNYCDYCDYYDCLEMSFYRLIDNLIADIRHLEAKVVFLRYSLSKFLPEYDGLMLRCDIFNDLSGCYWDDSAYQKFLNDYCGGDDPMDNANHCKLMIKLSRGEASVGL